MSENEIKEFLLRGKDGYLAYHIAELSEVISEYIFEKKGVRIAILPPQTQFQVIMVNKMGDVALRYWWLKLFKTEE